MMNEGQIVLSSSPCRAASAHASRSAMSFEYLYISSPSPGGEPSGVDEKFQSSSSKQLSLSVGLPSIAAIDEVRTTRGRPPVRSIDEKTLRVPSRAGSKSCCCGAVMFEVTNGEAVWKTTSAPVTQPSKAPCASRSASYSRSRESAFGSVVR